MFGPFSARVALALCEAGTDIDVVDIEGEVIGMEAFKIGRKYIAHEAMVI